MRPRSRSFYAQWICRESTSLRSDESTVVDRDWFTTTCAMYGIVSRAAWKGLIKSHARVVVVESCTYVPRYVYVRVVTYIYGARCACCGPLAQKSRPRADSPIFGAKIEGLAFLRRELDVVSLVQRNAQAHVDDADPDRWACVNSGCHLTHLRMFVRPQGGSVCVSGRQHHVSVVDVRRNEAHRGLTDVRWRQMRR